MNVLKKIIVTLFIDKWISMTIYESFQTKNFGRYSIVGACVRVLNMFLLFLFAE